MPRAWLLLCFLSLTLAAGCEPHCREVEPASQVQASVLERAGERLDDLDATDAQRTEILRLVRGTFPELEKMRVETRQRQRLIVAELKRDAPDRERLARLIDQNIDAGITYMHRVIDVMLEAHALLTPDQRRRIAAHYSKPSERFEGSFLLDRGVDYFLSRIDATDAQRGLAERIKRDLIARGQALQRKSDALRREAAHEFARAKPDAARIHGALDRGRDLTRTALFDLTGYYLLFASKLGVRQRQLLNAEMVRFEPCSPPGPQLRGG